MSQYTTQYVMNLMTGEPLRFEVDKKNIEMLNYQQNRITNGEAPSWFGTIEKFTRNYEFSLFPSYKHVVSIFFENGYTDELMTQILTEFGLPMEFISRLLEDKIFISNVKRFFEGITCDGERASRTLKIVYDTAKNYFDVNQNPKEGTGMFFGF